MTPHCTPQLGPDMACLRLRSHNNNIYAKQQANQPLPIDQWPIRPLALSIAASLALNMALSTPLLANTITVDTHPNGDGVSEISDNDLCSLKEAIMNANNGDDAQSDCDVGSAGEDTIELPNAVFSILSAFGGAPNSALPEISSDIIIQGSIQGSANAADTLIERGGTSNRFRFFKISSNQHLQLKNLTISNGSLTGNTLADGSGGAIYLSNNASLSLSNSILSNNESQLSFGGAISNQGGTVNIDLSILKGNQSNSKSGGAIYSKLGSVNISNSTLRNNIASDDGAAMASNNSIITISQSTLSSNTAVLGGGALQGTDTTWSLVNSTISNNQASKGGALFDNNGTATLYNSTLTDNHAATQGGAIFLINNSTLNLHNSLLANSTGSVECHNEADTSTINADEHNLIEGGSCSTASSNSVLTVDPQLGLLADNDGASQSHLPLEGSPLLEAGDDAICNAAPVNQLDQRGIGRPQSGRCDIGAIERVVVEHNLFIIPLGSGEAVIFGL